MIEPIPGESLLSLVTRTLAANVIRSVSEVIVAGQLSQSVAAFLAFNDPRDLGGLARLLSVTPDEIAGRTHRPMLGPGRNRERVEWFGTHLRRRFIEADSRRFAPAALAASPHHRAVWNIRALPYCPETLQMLCSTCPACGVQQGWVRTWGPERCDECRADLSLAEAVELPSDHHEAARLIAGLIDPLEEAQAFSVAAMPTPFCAWSSGQVFEAIFQLGAAWVHSDDKLAAWHATDLGRGKFDRASFDYLIEGLRIVQGWPQSLPLLVERVWTGRRGATTSLKTSLGPLCRFFQSRKSTQPLNQAVHAEINGAVRLARIPLKSIPKAGKPNTSNLLSEAEASRRFKVSNRTLQRLDEAGKAPAVIYNGISRLYDHDRLRASVERVHACLKAGAMYKLIGVPAFCVGTMAEVGLLDVEQDHDACLLANGAPIYTCASVEQLKSRLAGLPVRASAAGVPLGLVLAHELSPRAWAVVYRALVEGELAITNRRDDALDPCEALWVDPGEAAAIRKTLGPLPYEPGVRVHGLAAGRLLYMRSPYVTSAVRNGVIGAEGNKGTLKVSLATIAGFDERFVMTGELMERSRLSKWEVRATLTAADTPVHSDIDRNSYWSRREAEAAMGLSPLPALQLRVTPAKRA